MGSVGRQNWEIIPEGVLSRNCPAKGNRGSFLFSLVAAGSVLPSTSVPRKGHQDFSKWKNPIFTSAALKSQREGGNLGSQQSIPGFFQAAKLNGATSAAPDPPWLSLAQQSLPSEPRAQPFVDGAEGNNRIWQRVLHPHNAESQIRSPPCCRMFSKLASGLNRENSQIWRGSLRLSQGKGEKH